MRFSGRSFRRVTDFADTVPGVDRCEARPLIAGQTVLVQGTGGVSMFALQYAKAAGAQLIATTSSESKAEKLRALGADHVINYVEVPEWHEEVRRATGGLGVDRVVEVGGPGTIQRSIASTIIGGHGSWASPAARRER